jgi:hypothetical protein
MTRTVTLDLDWPIAPRATASTGISHAEEWAWKVAQRTYEIAASRYCRPAIACAWKDLSRAAQDIWYWRAVFVMAAIDAIEDEQPAQRKPRPAHGELF